MSNSPGVARALPEAGWPAGREAPPPLERVRRFLNTANLESGADRFLSTSEAQAWLVAEGHSLRAEFSSVELRQLVTVREALRRRLTQPTVDRTAQELDSAASALGIRIRFFPEARLEPIDSGAEGVVATLLITMYDAARDGTLSRLKVCARCQWVFYDRSKNSSGTWCSTQVCGARHKAAAYRSRNKERAERADA